MFNTSNYKGGDVTNTLKINACSGGIYKTYPESWFKCFHLQSPITDILFKKENVYYDVIKDKYYDKHFSDVEEILILQMVICGDMEVIAELILKKDFERYCNKIEEEQE